MSPTEDAVAIRRYEQTITRDTRVQLVLVMALVSAFAVLAWRWSGLETTVNLMRVDLAELRLSSVDGSRNRWTSTMQAEYEKRIADDIDYIRRKFEGHEARLDALELWATSQGAKLK